MKTNRQFLLNETLLRLFTGLIVAATLFLSANAQTPGDLDPDFFGGRTSTGLTRSESVYGTARTNEKLETENRYGKFTMGIGNNLFTPLNFGFPFNLENQIFKNVFFNQTASFNSSAGYASASMPTAAAGELDTTFNAGVQNPNFLGLTNDGRVRAIAIQPDGKHIIAGNFQTSNSSGRSNIARFYPDGTLDETFDPGVGFPSPAGVIDIALQPDGKIIVGGNINSYTNAAGTFPKFGIVRLNSDGSLDNAFNPGQGVQGSVKVIVRQPDGKILIGGQFTMVGGIARANIARLNDDGTLDNSFTVGTGAAGIVEAIALQSDGKVVIGGDLTVYNGTVVNDLFRVDAGGVLDSAFNIGTGPNAGLISAVKLQPDGKILVGGGFTQFNGQQGKWIVRLNTNGSRDNFLEGTICNSLCLLPNPPQQFSVLANGQIYISSMGSVNANGNAWGAALLRYNVDGSRDDSFFPPFETVASPLTLFNRHAVQSDGSVIGTHGRFLTNSSSGPYSHIRRLSPTGIVDVNYKPLLGNVGLNSGGSFVTDVALQSDGKLLVSGNFTMANNQIRYDVARFNTNGSLDTSFNYTFPGQTIFKILPLPDGKIIVCGAVEVGASGRYGIARLNSDGSLDNTFVGTGAFGGNTAVYGAALQPDGKIIIIGRFDTYNGVARAGIARINTDGAIDNSFNPGSGLTVPNNSPEPYDIGILPDGKIVVVGYFTAYNGIARQGIVKINANGLLDESFNPNGHGLSGVLSLEPLPNGQLLVGGTTLYRFNSNGIRDMTFMAPSQLDGGVISEIRVLSNGKIIIGGSMSTTSGPRRSGVIKLQENGAFDLTFGEGLRGADLVGNYGFSGLEIDETNNHIYYGGFLYAYNNIGRGSVARIFLNTPTVATTVQTNPAGRAFTVDGVAYKSAQTFSWETGSNHTISTTQLQAGTPGTRYIWTGWSDGGAISHTVTPTSDATYTANFTTQHQLTMNAGAGGTVSPGNGNFYDAGSTFQIVATANAGFTFANWTGTGSGSYSGTNNPVFITMNAPISQTASFNTQCSYSLNPTSATIASSGGSGSFTVTAPSGCAWTATSNASWIQVNSGSGSGNGTVTFTVSPFPMGTADRIGTITVGGQTFTITQVGVCQWGFNPFVLSVTAAASTQTVVAGTRAGCDFTPFLSNQTPWITNLVSDINNQTITFQVAANSGAARSGNIAIGAAILSIQQSAFGSLNDQPILFTTNRDSNNEIYKMNVDGSNQQRLTNSSEGESGGFWSPDGQKILYLKSINSTTSQIWVMNADGSGQMLISEANGANNSYKWSPNGQRIVFVRRETGGTDQIWTMNANGSNKTRLTNTTTNDHFPDWSPDGGKIAFGRCNTSFLCDIFTVNADGLNQVNITPNSAEDDEDLPQWSEDGSKIIFGFTDIDASGQNLITSNIFIVNADGTNRQSLTNATATSSFAYRPGGSKSSISPNGSRIAASRLNRVFTTSTEFQNSFEVSSVGIDGSNLVNLTNNSVRDDFGAWSPDSAKMTFNSRRNEATDEIYTMNADGSNVVRLTFNTATDSATDWYQPAAPRRALFDFDGDGKADVSVFRPSNGAWYIQQSAAGFTGVTFGFGTDKLVPADYDGDGKADIAVYRNGTWYIQRSQLGFTGIAFGASDDIPVPGDYDGDGKADVAVFRPSNGTWYLQRSQLGFTGVPFGISTDKPVAADYDGDGKADIAVNRGGTWYIQRSQLGFYGVQFGDGNDKLVPADYDGDGKTDIAVFRPSNGAWYLQQSANGFAGIVFGFGTDLPTPADYDGDGKADIAVYRNGIWYLNRSQSGFIGVSFGASDDKPVPNALIP